MNLKLNIEGPFKNKVPPGFSPQYRMTWRRELKWFIAIKLLGWAQALTQAEASDEMLKAFERLFGTFENLPVFNTVRMRDQR